MTDKIFNIKTLSQVTGHKITSNMNSVMQGLESAGSNCGLTLPHRLVPYLAQLGHESQSFRYDREIWGPTAAQKRYEGRKDLGNTQPGDGKKFSGHSAMQITGRHNTTVFFNWCKKLGLGISVPNFVEDPRLINTDPWEGLGPIWYWDSRKINKHADAGRFDKITRVINGGYNGYADRKSRYTTIALHMLGYNLNDVAKFQASHNLVVDGVAGDNTRKALHQALTKMDSVRFGSAGSGSPTAPVADEVPPKKSIWAAIGSFIIAVLKKGK